MRLQHVTSTATETPIDPLPTSTEEGYLRRYNSKPQDTAAGRALLAETRMLADSDEPVWGNAA